MSADITTVKRGPVSVRIYCYRNKGHQEFKVEDYSQGTRRLVTRSTLKKAREKAVEIAEAIKEGRGQSLVLTDRNRQSYLQAMRNIRPTGVSLEVATHHYAEALKILGEDRILEAARYFAAKHPGKLPVKRPAEVLAELIENRKGAGLSQRYVQDLNLRCKRFAEAFSCPIGSITGGEVGEFLTRLNLSPRSRNNYAGAIRTLFTFAKSRKYLPKDHDELEHISRAKDAGGDIEIFTPLEIAQLLTHAHDDILPFIAIGAFAGLRSAELERLDWSEIDLAGGHIKVSAGKAKTASRRIIPIHDNLSVWLQPLAKRSGKVWPHSHPYLHDRARETAKDSGVKWKANALRHSFISYRVAETQDAAKTALEAGNSPKIIFSNYREIVTQAEAERWFSISPGVDPNIIALNAEAGRALP